MHVLLVRPIPGNDRFGLGPFFRIEPLGLEYIAAALEMRGHRASVLDLRYSGSIDVALRKTKPALVGIACMHALETDEVLSLAEHFRRASAAFADYGGLGGRSRTYSHYSERDTDTFSQTDPSQG